jgi:hypothetical protein
MNARIDNYSLWSERTFTVGVPSPMIEVTVLLEGAYAVGSGLMRTDLSADLPATDPYLGTVSVPDGFFTADTTGQRIVDWILVELRSGEPTGTQQIVLQAPMLLRDDGAVVDPQGESSAALPGLAEGEYYLIVRHRNHLAVMTASAQSFTANEPAVYDFTAEQAFGVGAMKTASDGRAMLWGGDGNDDGQVTAADFNAYSAATSTGTEGYNVADFNLDGQLTAPDFNLFSANTVQGAQTGVPPAESP